MLIAIVAVVAVLLIAVVAILMMSGDTPTPDEKPAPNPESEPIANAGNTAPEPISANQNQPANANPTTNANSNANKPPANNKPDDSDLFDDLPDPDANRPKDPDPKPVEPANGNGNNNGNNAGGGFGMGANNNQKFPEVKRGGPTEAFKPGAFLNAGQTDPIEHFHPYRPFAGWQEISRTLPNSSAKVIFSYDPSLFRLESAGGRDMLRADGGGAIGFNAEPPMRGSASASSEPPGKVLALVAMEIDRVLQEDQNIERIVQRSWSAVGEGCYRCEFVYMAKTANGSGLGYRVYLMQFKEAVQLYRLEAVVPMNLPRERQSALFESAVTAFATAKISE